MEIIKNHLFHALWKTWKTSGNYLGEYLFFGLVHAIKFFISELCLQWKNFRSYAFWGCDYYVFRSYASPPSGSEFPTPNNSVRAPNGMNVVFDKKPLLQPTLFPICSQSCLLSTLYRPCLTAAPASLFRGARAE